MINPFPPPPGIFSTANIMLTPPSASLFTTIAKGAFWKTWEQEFHALYPIYDHQPEYIGRTIHVWCDFYSEETGWAIIDGYSLQEGIPTYTILGLDLPSYVDTYSYTIGQPPPFNINTIWQHLINWPVSPLAGAIRWGQLWLRTDPYYLMYTTDIMHFNGLP